MQLADLLRVQLPKGFGGPAGGSDGTDGGDKADAKKDAKDAGKSSGWGSGGNGDGGSGGGSGSGSGSGGDPTPDMWSTIGALVLAGLTTYAMMGNGSKSRQEITWQELRNSYLAEGLVERLEVLNKETVVVHLRNTPVDVRHGIANQDDDPRFSGGSESSGAGAGAGAGTGAGAGAGASSSTRPRTVQFKVGSVESFERMLEDAQLDLGIHPRDFVPVKYSETTNIGEALMRLAPTVLIIGASAFLLLRLWRVLLVATSLVFFWRLCLGDQRFGCSSCREAAAAGRLAAA